MPEIKLKKRYPHIPIEDVTQIFNEGYLKGYENGLKTAIPIEWVKTWLAKRGPYDDCIYDMLLDWEVEKEGEQNVR